MEQANILALIEERAALIEALREALPILEIAAEREAAWNANRHAQHEMSQMAYARARAVLSNSGH